MTESCQKKLVKNYNSIDKMLLNGMTFQKISAAFVIARDKNMT